MKVLQYSLIQALLSAGYAALSIRVDWLGWIVFIILITRYIFAGKEGDSCSAFIKLMPSFMAGLLLHLSASAFSLAIPVGGLPVAAFFFTLSLSLFTQRRGGTEIPAWLTGVIIFSGHCFFQQPWLVAEALTSASLGIFFSLINRGLWHRLGKYLKEDEIRASFKERFTTK